MFYRSVEVEQHVTIDQRLPVDGRGYDFYVGDGPCGESNEARHLGPSFLRLQVHMDDMSRWVQEWSKYVD